MSGDTVTITEAVRRLEEWDRKAVPVAFKRAFYRAMDEGRKVAVERLLLTKLGTLGKNIRRRGTRRIELAFQRPGHYTMEEMQAIEANVIPLIVQRAEVRERMFSGGKSLTGGLETTGFAALIEKGGRTKSHQIKRIRYSGWARKRSTRLAQLLTSGYLKFQVGGRWVSTRMVTHPGSKVPRNPFLEAGAARVEGSLAVQLERSMVDSIREAGL
jgi:hypothetical protein